MAAPNLSSQFDVTQNAYLDRMTSISGSDVTGVFGHTEFMNLQGISVSVNREVHPIYVMGHADPVAFVRGKRGVAGSFVAVCNDRGALYDITNTYGVTATKKGDHYIPGRNVAQTRDGSGLPVNVLSEYDRLGYTLQTPQYYDQLPPFDVTLVGRGESLSATISRVGGIFIVSMGTGMSVDDNSIEQQMTFVALYYEDWRPAGRRNLTDPTLSAGANPTDYNPFAFENQGVDIIDPSAVEGADDLGRAFELK